MDVFRRLFLYFVLFFLWLLVLAGEPTRALEGHENPWTVSFEGAGLTLEGGAPVLACGEKIKATISLPRGTGDHQLKVLWVRPDGGVEQETTVKVKLSDQGQGNAMVWLLLNPEKDTVFADFSLGDLGRKAISFNGKWDFKIFFDKKFIQHEPFFVSCNN